MPKINVYLPDDLAEAVRKAAIPVSAVCQRALEQAVRRVTAIRETALAGPDDLTAGLSHFTPRAREAIRLGLERAKADGAATVGTGHLLAGILEEGQNLALHVLRAAEIDPAAVREALARRPVDGSPTAAQPLRFGDHAANALELTVTEATALGHNYVGCEHLLLGIAAEPDGTGGQLLRALGADHRLVRRAVTAALAGYVHLRAQATTPPEGVAAAVRQELAPIVARLSRLESHVGLGPTA
jgi:ATP-dependent Clp protease ATP-binding subunit ClpA